MASAFLIFLPALSRGRELSRFEEEGLKEKSEGGASPLEISWKAGFRVKRENKVSSFYSNWISCGIC